MKTVVHYLIKPKHYKPLYLFADRYAALAKNLYNAALFRIRQTFCGWEKNKWQPNECEVFLELAEAKKAYPSLQIRQCLTYTVLEKMMRACHNPDFFAGLPMQTAQGVLKQAAGDFKNWLTALRDYKKHPEKYTGRPRMPHYKKSDKATFTVTNQDAVLYPVEDKHGQPVPGQVRLKLPGMQKEEQPILYGFSNEGRLKQVKIKPFYGYYLLLLVMETPDMPVETDLPHMAGLDLGTDNIAAIACTDQTSVVFKGGAVLSENRWFAKKRADAVAIITKGHAHLRAESAHLNMLSLRHSMRNRNFTHQCSRKIIDWCRKHQVGVLVIGRSKRWKQHTNMGKQNNQKFVSVPHYQLIQIIAFKAMLAGIHVIEQEESYTSKADVTAADPIPVYGKKGSGKDCTFSGSRVERGLYRTCKGYCINADCNGAANILRKAIPDAWKGVTDFRFLGFPESMSYKHIIGASL